MVMAGMGFDAAIMEGASEQIKAKVGWLAYVVSGLRNLMFPAGAAWRSRSTTGRGPGTARARSWSGNVGYLTAGMPLLPDASIDDGILDIVILHPRLFLSWIPLALRVLSKGRRTDEHGEPDDRQEGQHPGDQRDPAPARRRLDRRRQGDALRGAARPAARPRPPLSRAGRALR